MHYILLALALFPSLAFSQGGALLFEQPKFVAAGDGFTCVLAEKKIQCWGNNQYGQTDAPQMKRASKVAVAKNHACALGEEGVKCWGSNEFGQTNVPTLTQPTDIALGDTFSCALENGKPQCWGKFDLPRLIVNPRLASVGGNHACLLDDEGIRCFSNTKDGVWPKVPRVNNVSALVSGENHSCALSDTGVHCWNAAGSLNIPRLRNPRVLSAGGDHTCAIDEDGAHCWGNNDFGQNDVPKLTNPRLISTSGKTVCAFADEGLRCWGKNEKGEASPPALRTPVELSVSDTHACGIENEQVFCWGARASGIELHLNYLSSQRVEHSTKRLHSNPKETCLEYLVTDRGGLKIFDCSSGETATLGNGPPQEENIMGSRHECRLRKGESLRCWGRDVNPNIVLAPQGKVYKLVAAGEQLCLKFDNSLSCARNGKFYTFWVNWDSSLKDKPWDLAAGPDYVCLINQKARLECFWHSKYQDEYVSYYGGSFAAGPGLAVGRYHACASEQGVGVHCWGDDSYGQTRSPLLPNVSQISAYGNHSCAINNSDLNCWGENGSGQAEVDKKFTHKFPTFENPRFHLEDLGKFLQIAKKFSVESRSRLYEDMIKFLEKDLFPSDHRERADSEARYLTLYLLGPTLQSSDSDFAERTLAPALRESQAGFERALGFSGVESIAGTGVSRKAALLVLKAALGISGEFFDAEGKEKLQSVLRAIGQALTNPSAIEQVKSEGAKALPLLDKLKQNPKTAFLAETVRIALNWLR